MRSIWITQCLQNDFVRLLEPYEPLPNALHVGYSEALRLLGEKPAEGPLQLALNWAYAEPADKLALVHIRDWHNPEDPDQSGHLRHFGAHCLAGSEGAEFVFQHRPQREGVHIVQASGLNDFHGTGLPAALESLGLRTAPDTPGTLPKIRVGLAGVWTEAKVYFLAYELLTRYANIELSVCSALCASSSRHMHFTFLQQMKDILGVRVFASISDFTAYLTGSAPSLAMSLHSRLDMTRFEFLNPVNLNGDDQQLLLYLFRDSQTASFKVLDGGFSGNAVLRASSRDHHGHQQVPVVVKLGKRELIARERMSFEQIQEVLGNNAPSIVDFAESGARGGIKYRYAAMKEGRVRCVQDLIEELLLAWPDLGRPMRAADFDARGNRKFAKAWRLLCHTHSMYARLVQADRSPFQLHVAQLRYAVHTLGFDECTPLQKELALYTSLKLAEMILSEAKRKRALQIDWFPAGLGARVGLTILPGRKDWNRDLALDIGSIRQSGAARVVCLLTQDEFSRYGVPALLQEYRQAGLKILHEPIVDGGVPDSDQLRRILDWLTEAERQDEKTVIHCVGGLGRSGLVASAWLRFRHGLGAAEAIDQVRRIRSPRAVETSAQEAFIAALEVTSYS